MTPQPSDSILTDAVLRLLARRLRAGSFGDRLQVIMILSADPRDKRTTNLLLEALDDPDPQIRVRVLATLAQRENSLVLPPIIQALEDEHPGVRRQAVEALGKLRDPETLGPLLMHLEDDDHWVRWAAIDAVAWEKSPRVAEALRACIADEHPIVRRRACEMFATGMEPIPVDDLLPCVKDEDMWVRFWAIEALRAADDCRVVLALIAHLEVEDEITIRDRLIRALGYLQAAEAVEPLRKMLEQHNDDANLVSAILAALQQIDTPEAWQSINNCHVSSE